MTYTQIGLLFLTILATLYEIFKIGQVWAMVNRFGNARIGCSLIFMIVVCVSIQTAFIASMLGVNGWPINP